MRRLDEYKVYLDVNDSNVWCLAKNGRFSNKSFCEGLDHGALSSYFLKDIWTYGVLSKVNFFMWTAVMDKFLLSTI